MYEMGETLIRTENLGISFGAHKAVNKVDLDLEKNVFTTILGPNGAGKTTLFNLISGLLKPTEGKIFFKGTDITSLSPIDRVKMGMGRSFQLTNVFPSLTAYENVRLSMQARENVGYRIFTDHRKFSQLNKKTEEIYCNKFKLTGDKWTNQYQLTNNLSPKLYLDSLFIKDKLHLVYCEYQENLVVKYERYEYGNNFIKKEIEEELSNWENISWPTLIYFENKLWIIWAEYENIMSRYSLDNGENWSPIYLWKDSKYKDIFRYKYLTKNKVNNIFNYSFGTIKPDIAFIGFGSLNNTIEIPLKKKMRLHH